MRLNFQIPLSNDSPNYLQTLALSDDAANQAIEMQRGNDQYRAVRQHGAGAANGNQDALNALAGFDPMMASDLQTRNISQSAARQNMQHDRERMQMDRERMQMDRDRFSAARQQATNQIAQQAQNMTAAQAQQEAEKTERLLQGAAMAANESEYNTFLQSNGVDPQDHPFSQRDMALAMITGAKDAYQIIAARNPQPEPGYQETVFGPDGNPIMTRGPANPSANFTEAKSKDIGFATRARDALNVIEQGNPNELTSRTQRVLSAAPLGLGREFQSDNYQVMETALQQFLVAILRKDTGAAVTPQETVIYGRIFMPQPGDGDAVLLEKARAREIAVSGLEAGMNIDQIVAQVNGMQRGDNAATIDQITAPEQQQSVDFSQMTLDDLLAFNPLEANLDEINAWSARMDELGAGNGGN
ncbi:MAG: hypothetical protein U5K75_12125 [Ahrensia sp.]|nr:hypothetical protein [Ahrensia sp.]